MLNSRLLDEKSDKGQGIEAAREKKKYTGRKTVITKDLIKTVEKDKDLGVSITEIARITGKKRKSKYFSLTKLLLQLVVLKVM